MAARALAAQYSLCVPARDVPQPFVLGGTLRTRPCRAGVLSIGALLLMIAVPLRGLFRSTGSSMEEGFMLVFPKRMLAGAVPNVDFLHLYGPGSLHVLEIWYSVFGYTLEAERAFGLLQHLGLVFAAYALARCFGHRMAVISAALVTLLVLTPTGLSALAWEGGMAFAMWSVVFALRATHVVGRSVVTNAAVAGLLAGLALTYRPDLVIAIALAHGWLLWRSRAWKFLAGGFVVGLTSFYVHLAHAGFGATWRGIVVDPLINLRPGRELPHPPTFSRVDGSLQALVEGPADRPWWKFPAMLAQHQLFVWFFVVFVSAFAVPMMVWLLARRSGWTPQRVAMSAAGLLGLGMLPQAFQRPDSTHLAWGSAVTFAVLPLVVYEWTAIVRPAWKPVRKETVVAVLVAATLFVVCPFYTYRTYLLSTRISLGNKQGGFEVSRDGRRFYWGNHDVATASQAAVDDLAAQMTPGQRLLVGPADLSRTIYTDSIYYYYFPELIPATYYIEMDPGLADKQGSRLASDVESADWLILTNLWTGWWEPNASSIFGSDAPNQVVAQHFCLVGNYQNALVMLYRKCDHASGVSPAGIGIGAQRHADFEAQVAKYGSG